MFLLYDSQAAFVRLFDFDCLAENLNRALEQDEMERMKRKKKIEQNRRAKSVAL